MSDQLMIQIFVVGILVFVILRLTTYLLSLKSRLNLAIAKMREQDTTIKSLQFNQAALSRSLQFRSSK